MRLLLIEDEKKVAEFVARGLRAERLAVDVSHDGQSGWEMAQTYNYDLVILDLMLPGLGGTEVLKRIRKKDSNVPVLVLTARDGTAEKVENFEAGADDYLTKPFAFAELLVRVKALLRRGASEPLQRPARGRSGSGPPFTTGQARRQTHRTYFQGIQLSSSISRPMPVVFSRAP